MKKALCIVSVILFSINLLGCGIWASADTESQKTIVMTIDAAEMTVNGISKEIDPEYHSAPIIINNRTLIPIRAVIEETGGTVEWNSDSKEIDIYFNDINVTMTLNSKNAIVNGNTYILDAAPQIINSRTYVPLRFVNDSLGFVTDWDNNAKKITITAELESNTVITEQTSSNDTTKPETNKVNVSINGKSFSAIFYDNETADELKKRFPLTLNMSELHGNEKYNYLDNSLPTDSEIPNEIKAGDIMLYGSDCIVLFYKDFTTSYSYTRIGHIENVAELENALGSGNVSVSFK